MVWYLYQKGVVCMGNHVCAVRQYDYLRYDNPERNEEARLLLYF